MYLANKDLVVLSACMYLLYDDLLRIVTGGGESLAGSKVRGFVGE